MLLNTACYAYAPMVAPTPQPGQNVAIDLSDQGRVGLRDRLGENVATVEGRVNEVLPEAYLLSVTRVNYIGGTNSHWAGERVQLSRDAVGRMQTKKFSTGRTFLATGIAVAGIVLFIGTRSLLGFGRQPDPPPSRTPPGDT